MDDVDTNHLKSEISSILENNYPQPQVLPHSETAGPSFKQRLFKKARAMNETDQYWAHNPEGEEIDPIKWWLTQKDVFPRLYKMALDYLSIPGSSVKSEEAFSQSGDIVSKKRSRLDSESVRILMCLKSWNKFLAHNKL